ncbi:MAG: BlaI/MecI/CopY family transcriptional regulator [Peptococcaceae bacterium]
MKQISMTGGIPFAVTLPTTDEIHAKLKGGYNDLEKGNVQDASAALQRFREKHVAEEIFDGSLPKFLTAFTRSKRLSDKEIAELQKLINEHKED